jgi:hypothetical protein
LHKEALAAKSKLQDPKSDTIHTRLFKKQKELELKLEMKRMHQERVEQENFPFKP